MLDRSPFSSPVESNAVDLVNERLDTWNVTISTVIDYYQGTPIFFSSLENGVMLFRNGQMRTGSIDDS